MRLSLHRRSKEDVEGPEILVADFPLSPMTFCGGTGMSGLGVRARTLLRRVVLRVAQRLVHRPK